MFPFEEAKDTRLTNKVRRVGSEIQIFVDIKARATTSTSIHAHHCSTYLQASIHTDAQCGSKWSPSQGTLLSVKLIQYQGDTYEGDNDTDSRAGRYFNGICVMWVTLLFVLIAVLPYQPAINHCEKIIDIDTKNRRIVRLCNTKI